MQRNNNVFRKRTTFSGQVFTLSSTLHQLSNIGIQSVKAGPTFIAILFNNTKDIHAL